MAYNDKRLRFGVLVTSLREELRIFQKELAERSGLSLTQIREIEQGLRVDLIKNDIVLKLASALQLTSLERQHFFLAAAGISPNDVFRKDDDTSLLFDFNQIIDTVRTVVSKSRVPTFVVNSFCDIIMANHLVVEFVQPSKVLFDTADQEVGGYNLIRLLFHPDSNYRKIVGRDWERQALLNLRFFRRTSFQYRTTLYFSKLMDSLKKYQLFEKYWDKAIRETEDEYKAVAIVKENYKNSEVVEYALTETYFATSPFGDLYMIQYIPLTDITNKIFNEIYIDVGNGIMEMAKFPDPEKY